MIDSCQNSSNHDTVDEDEAKVTGSEDEVSVKDKENESSQQDTAEEEDNESDAKFNEDLLCEHGRLAYAKNG